MKIGRCTFEGHFSHRMWLQGPSKPGRLEDTCPITRVELCLALILLERVYSALMHQELFLSGMGCQDSSRHGVGRCNFIFPFLGGKVGCFRDLDLLFRKGRPLHLQLRFSIQPIWLAGGLGIPMNYVEPANCWFVPISIYIT